MSFRRLNPNWFLLYLFFVASLYSVSTNGFDINTLLGGSSKTLLSNSLGSGGSGGNPFADILKNLFNSQSSPAASQSFCDKRGSSSGSSSIDEELDENCRREHLDIMFVVDGSGSVGEKNFVKVKNFLKLVVDTTEVGPSASHVGLIQFSTDPHTEFSLNTHSSNSAVKSAIDSIRYRRGGTYIGKALNYALEKELISSKGDRSDKKTVVIVITDGESSDEPKNAAEKLRAKGFSTLAIGVEPQSPFGIFTFGFKTSLDNEQLLSVAGDPDRVFRVCDFDKLDTNFKNALAAQICTESEICKNSYSDLIMVVDGSGSIGADNFVKVKTFLNLMVDAVEIGSDKTRIGVVQFNDRAQTEFRLDRYSDKRSIMKAIEDIDWMRGKTKIGKALSHVEKQMLGKNGDRPQVSDVVLVLTDGQSADDVSGPAQALRDRGVTTFALGITDNIDKVQLADIAGSVGRQFEVKDFESLDRRLKNAITSKICGEKEKITTTTVTTTIGTTTTMSPEKAAVAGLKRLGCYEDRGDRVFKTEGSVSAGFDALQTPRKCHDKCKAKGMELSGVQLHYYCFCGSKADLATTKELDAKTRCITYCPGSPKIMCGGSWTLSVYQDADAVTTTTQRPKTTSRRGGRGSTKRPSNKDCESKPTDIVFVIDGSSSIRQENFNKIKKFLENIASSADIGESGSQFSVVQFNDDPKTEFSLKTHKSESQLLNAIENIKWMEGETSVGRALRHVARVELKRNKGWRKKAETVVLVLTDGRSNDNPKRAAAELRRKGVKTLAIGVTDRVDRKQLKSIAGAPERMFVVKEFTDLNPGLQTKLADQVCGFGPLGPLVNRKPKKARKPKGKGANCQLDVAIGVDSQIGSSSSYYRTVYSVMSQMKKKGSEFALFRANEGAPLLEVVHEFTDRQSLSKLRKSLRTAHSRRLSKKSGEWSPFRESLEDEFNDGTRTRAVMMIVGRYGVSNDVADELADLDEAGIPVFIIKTKRGKVTDDLESQIDLITNMAEDRFLDKPKAKEVIDVLQCPEETDSDTETETETDY